MGTITCTHDVNRANAKSACGLGYRRDFAPVEVAIEGINADGTVHFTAKGSKANYTTTWKLPDIWALCPTTVETEASGLPAVGAEGILYLGAKVWDTLDADAKKYSPRLKWPQELSQRWDLQRERPDAEALRDSPADLAFDTLGFPRLQPSRSLPVSASYRDLKISVDRVRIVARLPGKPTTFEFQLFERGAPEQVLALGPVYITLAVRDSATGKFEATRMQLLEVHVHGKEPEHGTPAEIDLLDPLVSNAFQVVDFTAGHDVTLKLSQKGFTAFGEGWPPNPQHGPVAGPDRSRVVTFLARPAPGVDPTPPDGDNAIEVIRDAISPFVAVREVASLLEIVHHLRRLEFQPEVIQIIGHGSPGMLSLGYFWDSKYTDGDWGPFYLLDSNPYAYGVLMYDVKPPTRVLLAGCDLTADRASPMIADGRALVTDLHAMWGCDVLAADDLVGPENFESGMFVGSMRGYVGEEWKALPGKPVPVELVDRAGPLDPGGAAQPDGGDGAGQLPRPAPAFTDVVITSAPALGHANKVFLERTGQLPEHALDRYSVEVKIASILALREISFLGKIDGAAAEMHLMCNATLLQVIIPDHRSQVRYFRPGAEVARTLRGTPRRPIEDVPLRSLVFGQLIDNQLSRATVAPSQPSAPAGTDETAHEDSTAADCKPAASSAQATRPTTNGRSAAPPSHRPPT